MCLVSVWRPAWRRVPHAVVRPAQQVHAPQKLRVQHRQPAQVSPNSFRSGYPLVVKEFVYEFFLLILTQRCILGLN